MSNASATPPSQRCPQCGAEYPGDVYICATCRTLLVAPQRRPGTPRGVIVLLVAIIIALLAFAAHLAYQTLVLHRF